MNHNKHSKTGSSTAEKLIKQQLIIMAQQLDLLEKHLQQRLIKKYSQTAPIESLVNSGASTIHTPVESVEQTPKLPDHQQSKSLHQEYVQELSQNSSQQTSPEIAIPLSPGQRDLWFLSNLGADKSAAYNEPSIINLRGELHLPYLQEALQAVVNRRDALRIVSINGDSQTIASTLPIHLAYLDLSAEPEASKQKQVNDCLEANITQVFDFDQGPFFRTQLIRLNPQEYLLIMVFHHIIADGWSMELIIQELAEFYSSLCTKSTLHKPEPTQFSQYLKWLESLQTTQQAQIHKAYWSAVFQNLTPPLILPTDRPQPVQNYQGARQTVTLESELYQKLEQLSQSQGATLFMTLLAAWKIFISRLADQEHLIIGIPIAGQMVAQTRDLVGHCSAVLPVISHPTRDLSFTEFLAFIKKTLLDIYDHQSYFLMDSSNQAQDYTINLPQVVVIFNIDKFANIAKMYGLEATPFPTPISFAKYHLSLNGLQFRDKFILEFFYQTDLFDHQTINHWCHAFLTLLQGIVDSPQSRLSQLPLVSDEDYNPGLFSVTDTIWDVQPIHQQFEIQASQNQDRLALATGSEFITYGQLNFKANQLARYLIEQQTSVSAPIILCLQNPIQIAIAFLAGCKANKHLVFIAPFLVTEAISLAFHQWHDAILLTDSQSTTSFADQIPELFIVAIDTNWSIISQHSGENFTQTQTDLNLDFFVHLWYSGDQADYLPLNYLAFSRHISSLQQLLPLMTNERLLALQGCVGAATLDVLFCVLSVGTSLTLSDSLTAIENQNITGVMASLENLIPWIKACQANPDLLGSHQQKWIILDQGKLNHAQVKQLNAFSELVEFYRVYKSSTIPLVAAVKHLKPLSHDENWRGNQPVNIGDTVGEIWFTVRDSKAQILPTGVVGELCMEHPLLLKQVGTWISTHDRARKLASGSIEIHGITDELMPGLQNKISPKEIEITLKLCPLVRDTVVTSKQSTKLLVYVALITKDLSTLREVEQLLKTLISNSDIFTLIAVDTIPRTASGEADDSTLKTMAGVSLEQLSFVAPINPIEAAIAQSIQQILGKSSVGVHDNFLDLGLQSLQGAQLVAKIQTTQGIDISLRDLFEAPTVASLAARIKGRASQPLPPIKPLVVPESSIARLGYADYELSSVQCSLWIHTQMDSSAIAYNLHMSSLLEGELHIEALRKAFEAVSTRHESLRTTFVLAEDEPKQRVHNQVQVPYEFIDFSKAENPELQAYQYSLHTAKEPFDLIQGPLLRVKLLKLSDTKHVLLFTIHHLIIDGWSMQILEQEVFYCYTAYKLGQEPQLPALNIQYKDYAAWHNMLLQTDRMHEQRDYWYKKLAGLQPALNLPTDFTRPLVPKFEAGVISCVFDRAITTGLHELSRKYSASLYTVLVAVIKTLLYRITQQNDIVIGTSFAERPHPDLEKQIGYFINPLVLRDAIAGQQNFLSVLHQVRQTILEALENTLYPFHLLIHEIRQIERQPQLSSLFEVQVVFNNHPQNSSLQSGLVVSSFQNVVLASSFDMIFNFSERDDQLQLDIEYKTDLWKPERIEVIKERLNTLVVDIISHPEQRIDDLNCRISYEEESEETELVFNLDFN